MEKLIEALKAVLANDAEKAKFSETLQKEAPALYQVVFQAGHDVGYGKKGTELTAAQTAAQAAEKRISDLTKEVETLKANPDTAALHKTYGGEIETIKSTHKTEIERLQGLIVSERQSGMSAKLLASLTSGAKRVDPDYAAVLVDKPDVKSRLKANPDGTWAVMQKGKEIPFAVASVDAALAALADELKVDVPAKFVLATTDAGAGQGANPGAPAAPAGADLFKGIRESVTKTAEKKTGDVAPHGSFAALAAAGNA